jgi:hypothetical protein
MIGTSSASARTDEQRAQLLRSFVGLIPSNLRAAGRCILSVCWKLIYNAKSLETVARILAYVFIRAESKSTSSPPLTIELFKTLLMNKIAM